MYVCNGTLFDVNTAQVIGNNQYPSGWFLDPDHRVAQGIEDAIDTSPPVTTNSQVAVRDGFARDTQGRWASKWLVHDLTADELAARSAVLATAKSTKNTEINRWRATANTGTFTHLGKVFACDDLSRSDIDGVAGNIALTGAFPIGFPGAWKAVDNTYITLADVAAFKAMYAAMTAQGAANFNHSQDLKTALAVATTPAAVAAIVW
jgi:hypothetical protein